MKTIQQIKDRIHQVASTRKTFSGKTKAINKAFKNHNKKVDEGEEVFEVTAFFDENFYNCDVEIINVKNEQNYTVRI